MRIARELAPLMSLHEVSQLPADRRPVGLRTRPDLVLQVSVYQGETCWIVKDPLAMRYFRLLEPEYTALQALRQATTVRDIKHVLDARFPDRTFRIEDIQRLVAQFHQQGLMISSAENQAAPLLKRKGKETRRKLLGALSSVLALRFPGIDPDRFLDWLQPRVRWFFSPWFVAFVGLLLASASLLVLQNLDEFYRRLPGFYQFFGWQNMLLMGTILIFTKSLHELGHGLTCKHFGGECHEIGFMLLVLTPAMYCNTSDSWILPNKWHRIAIGAGGMYVEIILAAICTFIWWYTQPGWIHYLALNVMFLCSVSTVIFNANPLLRYDGYYILSDLLEIPNLAQKSRLALLSRLRTVCLGMDPIPPRFLPQRGQTMFALYSVASFFYRWFVYFSIMWFLTKVFKPYGLEMLGYTLIAASLVGILVVPGYQLFKFFHTPGRWRQVKKPRLLASAIVVAALGFFIAGIPLPHYIHCSFVVRPDVAGNVYVPIEGMLSEIVVEPGQVVEAGQVLVRLDDPSLRLELEQMRNSQAQLEGKIATLKRASRGNREAAQNLATTLAELEDVRIRIQLREQDLEHMTIRAPRNGVVFPPPSRADTNQDLSSVAWQRTPLDRENLNAWLPAQTLVCIVAPPDQLKAVLAVEQSDVQFLQPGQPVTLMFDEYRGERFDGQLASISRTQLAVLPRELSTTYGGPLGGTPGPQGDEVPQLTYFEASLPLSGSQVPRLEPGFRGSAKIKVGTASIGWRVQRFFRTLVNFR